MASPRPVGSQLRCRKARNGAVSRRVNERRGCVVVMAITFIWAGFYDLHRSCQRIIARRLSRDCAVSQPVVNPWHLPRRRLIGKMTP
jgi:hypothetical protein